MTDGGRHLHSIEDIKGFLLDRRRDVAMRYAPPATGSYHDRGQYFTLNPGRADKSVGSFVVHLDGPRMGRWNDFATGEHGDLLDLIRLSMGGTIVDALREARGFLGLVNDTPADAARRQAAAERSKALAAQARRDEADKRERRRRHAHALWLSGSEIRGTPVEHYLHGRRCIDIASMGHWPGALRYHPGVYYRHVDHATGEVIEGKWPAMLALAVDGCGKPVACHRTWLGRNPHDGRWDKAAIPTPKKVLGDYAGAAIHLWAGTGPRGGRAGPLKDAGPGQRLFVAEGIEDALSGAVILPSMRFWAAISVSNFAGLALPANVSVLTIVADRDEGPEARSALSRAIAAHDRAGREVHVWRNQDGGKDLNDALRMRVEELERKGQDVG